MIRINCDVCGADIKQNEVYVATVRQPNGQTIQMELCNECIAMFDKFIKETKEAVLKTENPL